MSRYRCLTRYLQEYTTVDKKNIGYRIQIPSKLIPTWKRGDVILFERVDEDIITMKRMKTG